MGNIVIGVDSSTQSTKAIAWDINGNVLAEGRCDIPLNNPSLEKFEQNVEDWWKAFCVSTQELCEQIDIDEVDGIAISNQRETLAKLDSEGKAVYPATVWMDKRSAKIGVPSLSPVCFDAFVLTLPIKLPGLNDLGNLDSSISN